jgi:hypothetical protein
MKLGEDIVFPAHEFAMPGDRGSEFENVALPHAASLLRRRPGSGGAIICVAQFPAVQARHELQGVAFSHPDESALQADAEERPAA